MVQLDAIIERARKEYAPRVVDGEKYSDFSEYCKAYRAARLKPGKDGAPKRPSFTLAPITAEGEEVAGCDVRLMVLGELPVDETGSPRAIAAELVIDGEAYTFVWEGLLPAGTASVPGAKRAAVEAVLAQAAVLTPAAVAEILAGILGRKAVSDFPQSDAKAQAKWVAGLTVDGLLKR